MLSSGHCYMGKSPSESKTAMTGGNKGHHAQTNGLSSTAATIGLTAIVVAMATAALLQQPSFSTVRATAPLVMSSTRRLALPAEALTDAPGEDHTASCLLETLCFLLTVASCVFVRQVCSAFSRIHSLPIIRQAHGTHTTCRLHT